EFVRLFARAVERTVAGERRQNELRGRELAPETYREVVLGKSGELIGCALAADAALEAADGAEAKFEAGRTIGLCYQMLDDLLDYCPGAATGKPVFQDHRRRLWTWPLELLPRGTWP